MRQVMLPRCEKLHACAKIRRPGTELRRDASESSRLPDRPGFTGGPRPPGQDCLARGVAGPGSRSTGRRF